MADNKPSICFVAPNNYAVLSGREDLAHIGGAEVQRLLVGRELARRGYAVSFVTLDHGQPDGVEHEGIRVYKMCSSRDGLPGLRFFYPRWTSLCEAMVRANADVYVQRTAGVESGQVAHWCCRNRKRFILSIANDPECDRRLGGKPQTRERWFYRYALRHADVVIAQTRTQQRMLAKHFGIDAAVVPSCAADPGPPPTSTNGHTPLDEKRILWVGRFTRQKRIDRLVLLAARCPEWSFDVVGGTRTPAPEIAPHLRRLESLPNVTLHGFVPYPEMNRFYRRAALLLSTSEWEGFPNVFLEAWSRGVPVASMIDPDDVVADHGLGVVASGVSDLSPAIGAMLSSVETWRSCSKKARRFFLERHTVEAGVDAFEAVLRDR